MAWYKSGWKCLWLENTILSELWKRLEEEWTNIKPEQEASDFLWTQMRHSKEGPYTSNKLYLTIFDYIWQ